MGAYDSKQEGQEMGLDFMHYIAITGDKNNIRFWNRGLYDCHEPQRFKEIKADTRFLYSSLDQVKIICERKNLCTISMKDGSCTLTKLAPRWAHHTTLKNGYFIGEKDMAVKSAFALFNVFDEKKAINIIETPNDTAILQAKSIDDQRYAVNFREEEEENVEAIGVIVIYSISSPTPLKIIKPQMLFLKLEISENRLRLIGKNAYESWSPETGMCIEKGQNDTNYPNCATFFMHDDIVAKVNDKRVTILTKGTVLKEYVGYAREKYAFSEYDWQYLDGAQQIDEYGLLIERKRIYGKHTAKDWFILDIRDTPFLPRQRCDSVDIPKLIVRRDNLQHPSMSTTPVEQNGSLE